MVGNSDKLHIPLSHWQLFNQCSYWKIINFWTPSNPARSARIKEYIWVLCKHDCDVYVCRYLCMCNLDAQHRPRYLLNSTTSDLRSNYKRPQVDAMATCDACHAFLALIIENRILVIWDHPVETTKIICASGSEPFSILLGYHRTGMPLLSPVSSRLRGQWLNGKLFPYVSMTRCGQTLACTVSQSGDTLLKRLNRWTKSKNNNMAAMLVTSSEWNLIA